MKTIDIDGLRIEVKDEGKGKPLILIHGACENISFWKNQISFLSNYFRVIAPNLPGHGMSSRLSDYTIESFSDSLSSLISALGLREVSVVGHSMGGAIAMRLALDHPELIINLVLANTGAKLGVLNSILEGLAKDPVSTLEKVIAPLGLKNVPDDVKSIVLDGFFKCGARQALADFKACNMFDVRNRIHEIDVPTLIVAGDRDGLTPLKWSIFLRDRMPNSRMVCFEGCYHYSMLERPESFNMAILRFLK